MKTRLFLLLAALAAIPVSAKAGTLWVSIGAGGAVGQKEAIDFASVGTVFVPDPNTAVAGVSPGTALSTLTIGDINGDGFPDISAMIEEASKGAESQATVMIGEDGGNGKTLWSAELDSALVYQVHFPSVLAVRKAGADHGVTVTFAGPQNPVFADALPTGRRTHYEPPLTVAVSIPGIQDPPGVTDVSDITLTFPAAIAPPGPTGTTGAQPPSGPNHWWLRTPSNIDDGYAEWMSSVIQTGSDVRPATFIYTFADGSHISFVLNLQIGGLSYSTDGLKEEQGAKAGAEGGYEAG